MTRPGEDSVRLAVFLGNPGGGYAKNRHNAGRFVAESFAEISWQKKFNGFFSSAVPGLPDAKFLMPETFMNLSGRSVAAALSFYKIPAERLLVVHDELELPPGVLSLKAGGGTGGHNGLRSIKAETGSADFWRLRIGIGRPPGEKAFSDVSGWVLSNFGTEDLPAVSAAVSAAAALLPRLFCESPSDLLPEFKKRNLFVRKISE